MAKEYSVWSFNAGVLITSKLITNNDKSIAIPKLNDLAKERWQILTSSIARGEDKVNQ